MFNTFFKFSEFFDLFADISFGLNVPCPDFSQYYALPEALNV